ncbi:aspartate/glutamate racemase family protein [Desulfonema ishimotonii]|uniref:Aspartate/glutamate racemase family protein n=1 Tax=Desulfonema ishimotonii TaxID=45657 RepID=A0A401G3S8_9BACT|nr:aspartate/glutamate racemase family protein [Desulfonema ishimotonii]GBC63889.1 aspartate/glutamate racemase family protein [Desulfonema ishimotonii]
MTIAYGGRTCFGHAIGIIMLDTVFPRIPGDIGNAATFPFPVLYRIVRGASPQRVVKAADPALLGPFIEAARELEKEGVSAIATSCGFLAVFHRELTDAVRIPVFTSSLLQARTAFSVIGKDRKVGVLTARRQSLTEQHLAGVGIEALPLVIEGMETADEFTAVFIEGKTELDVEKCEGEMIAAAGRLIRAAPETGAIVLECTNMPPFARAVQRAVRLPVFDAVTMVKYAHAVVCQQAYPAPL